MWAVDVPYVSHDSTARHHSKLFPSVALWNRASLPWYPTARGTVPLLVPLPLDFVHRNNWYRKKSFSLFSLNSSFGSAKCASSESFYLYSFPHFSTDQFLFQPCIIDRWAEGSRGTWVTASQYFSNSWTSFRSVSDNSQRRKSCLCK